MMYTKIVQIAREPTIIYVFCCFSLTCT